jgi:dihydrofolate synthase/folylpolyglutamate synthase
VIAPQEPEALKVIEERCQATGVAPHFAGRGIEVNGATESGHLNVTFETEEDRYEDVTPGLRGRHQAVNAAVAIRLAESLRSRGFNISRTAIIKGIERAQHPGRLELWAGTPAILFDGAHNGASAQALSDYLAEFVKAPITLLFGAMRDKELAKMAALLFPQAQSLILTGMNNPRAASPGVLRPLVPRDFDSDRVALASSTADAARLALEVTPPGGLILVTGSLYLVGEIRELLSKGEA